MAAHFEAVGEIIDACGRSVRSLTLLKGISISEECYPDPHLRLMRDVDLLIEKEPLSTLRLRCRNLVTGSARRARPTTVRIIMPNRFFMRRSKSGSKFTTPYSRVTEELLAPGCLALKTSLLSYGHHSFKAGKSVGSAWSCRSFTSPLTGHRTSPPWEVWWR